MNVIEHIKQLTNSLTQEQRDELAEYLRDPKEPKSVRPISLKGLWKDKFPEDLDVISAVREIRDEWKSELDLEK